LDFVEEEPAALITVFGVTAIERFRKQAEL